MTQDRERSSRPKAQRVRRGLRKGRLSLLDSGETRGLGAPPTLERTRWHTVQARMQTTDGNEAIFEAAVAFTRTRSPASFDQWFSGVQFDGLVDSGILSLRARDDGFVSASGSSDHFLPTLVDLDPDADGVERPCRVADRRRARHPGRRPTDHAPRTPARAHSPSERPAAGARLAEQPTPPPSGEMAAAPLPALGAPAPREGALGGGAYSNAGRPSGVHPVAVAGPPIEGLNPKYSFSNFVVGPSNQLAHACADRSPAGRR